MRQGWNGGGFETRDQFVNHLKTQFIERSRANGYCCFVDDGVVSVESNILMWGHYGDGLKGFKVTFDSASLIASLPKTVARAPILYGQSIPTLDILEHYRIAAEATSDHERALVALTATSHIRTKHDAWRYEQEYRFISPTPGAHSFDAKSIKSVVFGEKMPPSQRKVLSSVLSANTSSIEFKTARVSPGSYDLVID